MKYQIDCFERTLSFAESLGFNPDSVASGSEYSPAGADALEDAAIEHITEAGYTVVYPDGPTVYLMRGFSLAPSSLFNDEADTKAELESQFMNQSDEFWGVEFDEEGQSSFKNSDYSGTQCTGFACEIARKLPDRTKIFGFSDADNPGTGIVESAVADGHDFAVVDDRFIVDPWINEIEDVHENGVFDMENPRDAEIVKQLYGPQMNWKRMEEVENSAKETESKLPEDWAEIR